MNNNAGIDGNMRRALSALSNANDGSIVNLWANPTTHRLLVDNANTSATLAIGTTTITGGSGTTNFLYDNNGVLAEGVPTSTITIGSAVSGGTASQLLATDGSTNLQNLTVATYPSLTELSYVKGVTSAIQSQINAKGAGTVTAVSVATANGFSGSSSGGATPALTIVAGAITPTSVNGNTITTGTGTLTLGAGKTLTANNSITLAGTDSTTMTFPTTSASVARTDAAQTFVGIQTIPQILCVDNAITASGNAATVTRSNRNNVVTNNSASGLTVTLSTTSATGGDMLLVQCLPSSAVAQTITWVNTENSGVTPNANLNASTSSPTTDGFKWNPLTSKWRCIASTT